MKATLKTVIVGLLVIVFFGGIILLYYNRLYEERRSNITKDVEMTAVEQADQLEAYLSTNIDLINYSAYALDEMIREGQTDAEIQSYLVAQSTVVKNAILEDSTGLYGYINGKFFSGTNWVPPEGYDATIRPWYIKPMESVGEVSILEPYHDV